MQQYRTHRCPTMLTEIDDVDTLAEIAEDDERVSVKISCIRILAEKLLKSRDAGKDAGLLYEMYLLMKQLKWLVEVQKIALDALIVLCTADDWKRVVVEECKGLDEHLSRMKAEETLAPRIESLRRLLAETSALNVLRELNGSDSRRDVI